MITKNIFPLALLVIFALVSVSLIVWGCIRSRGKLFFRVVKSFLMIIIVALCLIIGIRPMIDAGEETAKIRNLDVLFVVDSTISMWGEDAGKNENKARFDEVIKHIEYVVDKCEGSSFALIHFDTVSEVLCPFTTDVDTFNESLKMISQPNMINAMGTSLNKPIEDMSMLLESSDSKQNRKTIVFFMSDGEITNNGELESYEELGQYIDGGAVLGYGTREGVNMYDKTGRAIKNAYGEVGVTKLDEDNLEAISDDLGITYIHITSVDDLETVLASMERASKMIDSKKKTKIYDDIYYYFAIPLTGLIAIELFIVSSKENL